jgi:hypothetical protein
LSAAPPRRQAAQDQQDLSVAKDEARDSYIKITIGMQSYWVSDDQITITEFNGQENLTLSEN